MTTLHVNVTQEHIDKGKKCNASFCPVALALNESLNSDQPGQVVVGRDKALLSGSYQVITLPYKAFKFIDNFDDGRPVSPFSFDLEVDDNE